MENNNGIETINLDDVDLNTINDNIINDSTNEIDSRKELEEESFSLDGLNSLDEFSILNNSTKTYDSAQNDEMDKLISEYSKQEKELNGDQPEEGSSDEVLELLNQAYKEGNLEAVAELLKEAGVLDNTNNFSDSYIATLSDEDVVKLELANKCPDCDESEIEEQYFRLKDSSSFDKTVNGIRKSLLEQEFDQQENIRYQQELESEKEIEQVQQQIYNSFFSINEIDGYENNQQIIDYLAPRLLEPSEKDPEYTVFINDLMESPEQQYKAAYWLEFGPKIIGDLNNQIKLARIEGAKEALTKYQSKGKNIINPDNNRNNNTRNNNTTEQKRFRSIDDITI
jgi:hypothetical protein